MNQRTYERWTEKVYAAAKKKFPGCKFGGSFVSMFGGVGISVTLPDGKTQGVFVMNEYIAGQMSEARVSFSTENEKAYRNYRKSIGRYRRKVANG